jgi:hypothetical protein
MLQASKAMKLTIDLGYIPPGPKILRLRRRSCQVGFEVIRSKFGLCKSLVKAWRRNFFIPPPHHEPRTFKSHIYTLRLICTCSVAQALSASTFRTQKDVKLTKLFKIAHRVVFRGRRTDFRDFKDRPKIACNSTKTKFFKNLKVVSDSP